MSLQDVNLAIRNGNLKEAESLASVLVKKSPTDELIRALYIEILCVQGQYEKADQQLNTVISLKPELALTLGIWRHLVHAAQTRSDVFTLRAKPELIEDATPTIKNALDLLLASSENDTKRVSSLVETINAQTESLNVSINNEQADVFRDLDDVSANIIEAFSSQGKYFWLDLSQVVELNIHQPKRLLDLIWRPASIFLTNGTEGEVFIPAIYPHSGDDMSMLGRSTEWVNEHGIYRGIGLKTWLVGESEKNINGILSLNKLTEPASATV